MEFSDLLFEICSDERNYWAILLLVFHGALVDSVGVGEAGMGRLLFDRQLGEVAQQGSKPFDALEVLVAVGWLTETAQGTRWPVILTDFKYQVWAFYELRGAWWFIADYSVLFDEWPVKQIVLGFELAHNEVDYGFLGALLHLLLRIVAFVGRKVHNLGLGLVQVCDHVFQLWQHQVSLLDPPAHETGQKFGVVFL